MSKAPEICLYCDGEGNSSAGGPCGFCENGKPLDTQEDWDNSWGKVMDSSVDDFGIPNPEVMKRIIERYGKRNNEG